MYYVSINKQFNSKNDKRFMNNKRFVCYSDCRLVETGPGMNN